MVKKLLKHEFKYYIRTFGLFLPIVLVVAVVNRVFRLFDDSNVINRIIISSSATVLAVSCMALLVLSTVVGIVRFYKNMYSAEGYLTFTLPITNAQHIFVKLLAAVACQAVCSLVVVAAVCIASAGDALKTFWFGFSYAMGEIFGTCGAVNTIVYILEMILLIICSAAASMLLFYACITVGQTAKKNRIIKAVGAYFVWYLASQVFSTVVMISITITGLSNGFAGIAMFVANHPFAAIHIFLVGATLFAAGLAALFWYVTQRIMTTKLNLE